MYFKTLRRGILAVHCLLFEFSTLKEELRHEMRQMRMSSLFAALFITSLMA
ncbi:MAG: hypothetical protein P8101_11060 [Candidatus Thiodiazotropha sp.]|jgi:hypothetical protein